MKNNISLNSILFPLSKKRYILIKKNTISFNGYSFEFLFSKSGTSADTHVHTHTHLLKNTYMYEGCLDSVKDVWILEANCMAGSLPETCLGAVVWKYVVFNRNSSFLT